jgi:hypothetical protein
MICYLWFSVPSHSTTTAEITVGGEVAASEVTADALLPKAKSMSSLQLITTPAFVSYAEVVGDHSCVAERNCALFALYSPAEREKHVYTCAIRKRV